MVASRRSLSLPRGWREERAKASPEKRKDPVLGGKEI